MWQDRSQVLVIRQKIKRRCVSIDGDKQDSRHNARRRHKTAQHMSDKDTVDSASPLLSCRDHNGTDGQHNTDKTQTRTSYLAAKRRCADCLYAFGTISSSSPSGMLLAATVIKWVEILRMRGATRKQFVRKTYQSPPEQHPLRLRSRAVMVTMA